MYEYETLKLKLTTNYVHFDLNYCEIESIIVYSDYYKTQSAYYSPNFRGSISNVLLFFNDLGFKDKFILYKFICNSLELDFYECEPYHDGYDKLHDVRYMKKCFASNVSKLPKEYQLEYLLLSEE